MAVLFFCNLKQLIVKDGEMVYTWKRKYMERDMKFEVSFNTDRGDHRLLVCGDGGLK